MKRFYFLMTAIAFMGVTPLILHGQADFSAATSKIALTVIVSEQVEGIPTGAVSYLTNKLKQAATQNGLAANEDFSRFFITATITPLSKDIVPGPPQQIAQNLEMTLFIADYFDQKIFATTTVEVKAVGTNDTKCYINGIKNINVKSKDLTDFIESGKQKIIAYYNAQCDNIIKKANSLAGQKQYEAAIYELTAIPDACDCYDRALTATKEIYQQYIDYLCDVNLAKAKTAWAAEQNSVGATKAGDYLSYIYPDAKCYDDAQVLYREIKAKVLDDWKFEMKIYQDGVNLEQARIKAWRDVGVAYGNHQQPVDYNINWLVR